MAFSFTSILAQDSEVTNTLPTDITYNVTTTPVESTSTLVGLVYLLLYIVLALFFMFCFIKIFQKAGRKWWEAIIPIYSLYILFKIIGRGGWEVILLFIPLVGIVVAIFSTLMLSRSFGQKDVFALGLLFLWPLTIPYLALSKNVSYVGPGGVATSPVTAQASPELATAVPVVDAPPALEAETPPTDQPQPPQAPPTNLVQ